MENTEGNGGPQVDCFDERESPGMKRELKEIGPQGGRGIDDNGDNWRQLGDEWWLMSY